MELPVTTKPFNFPALFICPFPHHLVSSKMASSSSSSNTSSIKPQTDFSFSSQFMTSSSSSSSFTSLLNSGNTNNKEMDTFNWGLYDQGSGAGGIGVEIPKFKSFTPSSLPLSHQPFSPSSYLAIPPGLSPAELLDSPVLFSTSNALASPTTGAFAGQTFNWRTNSTEYNQPPGLGGEETNYSDFSFQPQASRPPTTSSSSLFQSSSNMISMDASIKNQEDAGGYNRPANQTNYSSSKTGTIKSELAPIQSYSSEIALVKTSGAPPPTSYSHYNNSLPPQYMRESRRSEDGYNWRKYGQKQVKGSENPRSYYKCTYPNCPTKKKVERALDGQITEIVYKGSHNHPKPQSTRRSSSSSLTSSQSVQPSALTNSEFSDQSFVAPMESVNMPEDSSISMGEDDFDQGSPISNSGGDDDESEPDAKRWKGQSDNESILAGGSRTVREPRVVVQTTSDIDILDDGYRWRKYGQKVVKGNPNPRSYYKCTSAGCPVRKHVERASHDLRAVITTYEGKHNHDVPAPRGSGYSASKPPSGPDSTTNAPIPIRPSVLPNHSTYSNSLHGMRFPTSGSQSAFTLERMQSSGSFGFPGFGKQAMGSFTSQAQYSDEVFSEAKPEPKDDGFQTPFLY